MYDEPDKKALAELAIDRTRRALAGSKSFQALDVAEQKQLFNELYRNNYSALAKATGTPAQTAKALNTPAVKNAGDMIDDQRHLNQRIDQAGDLGADFIKQLDFPQFVADLLNGVFEANMKLNRDQMEAYRELLSEASKSVSAFVNQVDDAAAFGYLAENNSDEFSIDFGESGSDGSPTLTNSAGEPVDIGDNEVKSRIMDAKIAMAQEHRAMLRETLLMGVQRLIVEKGNIKASVLFDIKANEEVIKRDKAANKTTTSSGTSGNFSGGLIGKIFGAPGFGKTESTRSSSISVATVDSKATTELAAKIAGSVDITFRSDFFALDNFATMYGPGAGGAQAPQASSGTTPGGSGGGGGQ